MANLFRIPDDIKPSALVQSDAIQIINIGDNPIWVGHAMSGAPEFRSVLASRVELARGQSVNVVGRA